MTHFQLRRQILTTLYEHFREFPYAPLDIQILSDACGTVHTELNWNLVYLEKSGLVELGTLEAAPPFIACSVVISASGIDLIENDGAFQQKFPMAPEPERLPGVD